MLRILLLSVLLSLSLFADKRVELFSANVDTNGTFVQAQDDVVILYDGMYLSAESATYNRDTGIIELYGNVTAMQGAQYYTMGDYLMLDMKEDKKKFSPFFFREYKDELWMTARSAQAEQKEYELHTGVVSSCNPQDPDWTMRFSSGYYDDEDQWVQLYNARLYAGEVPVFYFPYIAYPTDTTRRTGLLRPTFGLSSDEGFMYEQPLYIAESPYWDLEILPQIRTKRGRGLYNRFRFVDSPQSTGSLTVGGFREKLEYQQKFNLKNDEHYGAEFDYAHRNFLRNWFDWDVQGSSGAFADITYLNDVEYLNLQQNDALDYSTASQVRSRVNFFLNQNENYYGLYGKYFIDLNKDSNADTIQNLPIAHYHHYLNTLIDNNLFYSVDYRGNNYYREKNKNAFENEMRIPVGLQFSLLDEYLTFSATENIYASHLSFYSSDTTTDYNPGYYVRDYQDFELNTNLVKAFEDFSHSLSLSVGYTLPGTSKRSGFYEENTTCQSTGSCEFKNLSPVIEEADIELSQFIFNETGREVLYHRLRQPIVYEKGYDKYGDLENELRYNITQSFNYYNNTFYNYDRNVISKTQNSIGYNDAIFIFNVSHLYEDKLLNTMRTQSSYVTTDARYNYSQRWQYYAGYAYDIKLSETKNRHLGFLYNKRCWSVDLKYVENIRPILDASGQAGAIQDKILYLTLNLRPMGGFEVHYKKSENE